MGQKTQNPVSYYDVLHVRPSASNSDIKKAYHRLAKRFHPDRNPKNKRRAEIHFSLINEAYSHISTKERRENYNLLLRIKLRKLQKRAIEAQNDNLKDVPRNGWFARIFRPANAVKSNTAKVAGAKKNG